MLNKYKYIYNHLTFNYLHMRKIILILLCLNSLSSIGQKARDVIENSRVIEKKENLFLSIAITSKDTLLRYHFGEKSADRPVVIKKDSLMFTVKNESVNIYIQPLNPLTFSYSSTTVLVADKIEEDAADALNSIVDLSKTLKGAGERNAKSMTDTAIEATPSCPFGPLENAYNQIKSSLQKTDKKSEITAIFNDLKALTFINEAATNVGLSKSKSELDGIERHFESIQSDIDVLKKAIDSFQCSVATDNPFIVKYVFGELAKNLQHVKDEQFKRVKNLKKAYQLTKDYYDKAKIGSDGLEWWLLLDSPDATPGKISVYTFKISKSGYRLANAKDKEITVDEIIEEAKKEVGVKTFRIRRFQRFVPEVSAGIAYTTLNYPKYGVTQNEAGGSIVTHLGVENINRLNITAFLNYNYYISDSSINPFIQLGTGVNTEFPVLLIGTGLRIHTPAGTRFSFSVGFAGSWIKTLKTLEIGSEVSDENELEKDLEYQFAKPKIYYGIQYNF